MMETTGAITSLSMSFPARKAVISFEIAASPEECEKYRGQALDITFEKHREHRSNNANRLLWECIGRIARETGRDKWTEYLDLLRDYGRYTYIAVKPNMVDAVKRQWRECEEIGEITINGEKAVQLLCYFGSSTYNSKEFAALLDGTIQQMKTLGIDVPPTGQVWKALKAWEQEHG